MTCGISNYAEAASWYRKAADQGYRPAETSLGSLYERGLGVPKNKAIALEWYRKSADAGESSGMMTGGDI